MSQGPVEPVTRERLALLPLSHGHVALTDGFWSSRQRRNREVTIPYGIAMLEQSGTMENLRIAAGSSTAEYKMPLFRDSDLYKVLEAVAWERSHGADDAHERFLASSASLLSAAQEQDGYLNSYVQVVEPGRRFANPAMGHELYCAGHLLQAAVADARTSGHPSGSPSSLGLVASRFASYLTDVLPREQAGFVPGHPEIETALVELYRTSRDRRLLDLAADLLDRRGRGALRWHNFGPSYFQDDVPFEQATTIRGHAVRALYLLAGATDVYTETGATTLLPPILAQWSDMTSSKTYITGGVGSRHQDEAFGDPFELPPDRAYCETCAAIASVMWNWRLLLLTGEGKYAELMERTLYNGFLAGVGLDGTSFFYVNPLQARTPSSRSPWYDCACCPPNVMRLLASLEHYVATTSAAGVQIHQYFSGTVHLPAGGPVGAGPLELLARTDYPHGGTFTLRVVDAPGTPLEISLRIPTFADGVSLALGGKDLRLEPDAHGYVRVHRTWTAGDELQLEIPMRPRALHATGDVDGARGCVAFERGPLVYCIEGVDVPRGAGGAGGEGGAGLRGISVDPDGAIGVTRAVDVAGEPVVALRLKGRRRQSAVPDWPYAEHRAGLDDGQDRGADDVAALEIQAVPYYAWANRGASDMRVWIPAADARHDNM
ncbi:MAG: glycoside hydrolase family 127 protein [Acidimicrobiales bacterium]